MSLILSGTDGLSDVDGSASTPAIRGTDANTGIFFPAADTIAFSEGGVESMRIDASGNLGINTTTPRGVLDVLGSGSASSNNWAYISGGNVGATNPSASFSIGLAIGQNFSSGNSETNLVWGQTVGSGQYFSISKWTGSAVTEQLRINSSGNVGIGTSNPTSSLVVAGNIAGSPTVDGVHLGVASGFACIELCGTSGTGSLIDFTKSGSDAPGRILYNNTSNFMGFSVNNSERVRINSSGALLVATTIDANTDGVVIQRGGAVNGGIIQLFKTGSGLTNGLLNYYGNTYVGGINFDNTSTSFPTSSDIRLKKNIVDAPSAISKVQNIRIVSHGWKNDDAVVEFGVIAQELAPIAPSAVMQGDDGEEVITTWSVDYSKLVPILTKAIQEQQAMIEELKAEVAALKAT